MNSAAELLAELLARPEGQISPSIYETGRVVALAPWLSGRNQRWEFLLSRQQPDGSWGGRDEYSLVPTLSATEAILTSVQRDQPDETMRERLRRAADAGLRRLFEQLGGTVRLPDTVAVELIVPELIERLNDHLAMSDGWWGSARLCLAPHLDTGTLSRVRAGLAAGMEVPAKLLHSLEVTGTLLRGAPSIRPTGGAVCCSPAATAAWLADQGHRDRHSESVGYLEDLVARYGGPVPSVVPISVFERTWVLAELIRANVDVSIPRELIDSLDAAVADGATPGAPGLPPDADTTSATLFTLARLGRHRTPDCLLAYELDTHFCCWQGEKTSSPTANAHVLEAFAEHVADQPKAAARYRAAITKISRWLGDCQQEDGSWTDKWHASPYYATACCVQALGRADGEKSDAVRRAVDWVLGTQRSDGSWGRWTGTAEETAYAMQILVHAGTSFAGESVARGYAFLLGHAVRSDLPPLWQDKDLYTPTAVVRATILATLNLVRTQPRLASLVDGIAS